MQGKDGIFIPMEIVHAFVSAVLLLGMLFAACVVAYYLWRALRWNRLRSKAK